MLEAIDSYLVKRYLDALSKEMSIQGLPFAESQAALAEAKSHLEEAMAGAKPQNESEALAVLRQFGAARSMASELAKEHERGASKRRYLWPVALALLWISSPAWLPFDARFKLGDQEVWFGSIILPAIGFAILISGYKARRPVFGQFVTVAGALFVLQTGWYAATSFPVAHGWPNNINYFEAVRRSEVGAARVRLNKALDDTLEIQRLVRLGQRVYSNSNRSHSVPKELLFRGEYLSPEGVREVQRGMVMTHSLHPSLHTTSWSQAVRVWNASDQYTNAREAQTILDLQGPIQLKYDLTTIANFEWIIRQPIWVQLPLDIHMAAIPNLVLFGMAAAITNAGYVLWLLARGLRRAIRRRRFGSGLGPELGSA